MEEKRTRLSDKEKVWDFEFDKWDQKWIGHTIQQMKKSLTWMKVLLSPIHIEDTNQDEKALQVNKVKMYRVQMKNTACLCK